VDGAWWRCCRSGFRPTSSTSAECQEKFGTSSAMGWSVKGKVFSSSILCFHLLVSVRLKV